MRKDIEEIGKILNIDLAFNVILNSQKQVVDAFFGDPYHVMEEGINKSRNYCKVKTKKLYDLVIASPGGFPKDINLYQSQKAITHACSFTKKHGVIILVAECRDGFGSESFMELIIEKHSPLEVITAFKNQEFQIGPHKAYLLAKQLQNHPIILISKLDHDLVKQMFMFPANSIQEAMSISSKFLPKHPRIAFLPYATHLF
jgi:nickel-dependent lactate racemase